MFNSENSDGIKMDKKRKKYAVSKRHTQFQSNIDFMLGLSFRNTPYSLTYCLETNGVHHLGTTGLQW